MPQVVIAFGAEQRGNAEGTSVMGGDDGAAGLFVALDQSPNDRGLERWLVAREQDDSGDFFSSEFIHAGANGTADSARPFRVMNDDRMKIRDRARDARMIFATDNAYAFTATLARGAHSRVHQRFVLAQCEQLFRFPKPSGTAGRQHYCANAAHSGDATL